MHTLKSRCTQNESLFGADFSPEQGEVVTVFVFEDRIISRRADVVWPPRSRDLAPLDYYLWGDVKDKCYTVEPETIDALKDKIREAIDEIQLHTMDNVLKNWTDRVGYCMARRDSLLNEIIFHY